MSFSFGRQTRNLLRCVLSPDSPLPLSG